MRSAVKITEQGQRPLTTLVTALSVAIALLTPAIADQMRVIDGDTIADGTTHFRLFGIDAPEKGQSCVSRGGGTWACGEQALALMQSLVIGKDVTCEDRGDGEYGRRLGLCRAGGIDVSGAMVDAGMAWSFRQYAHDYDAREEAARTKGLGVWQAPTETPWDFRADRWKVAVQTAPNGCPIKGNINARGEKIYHPPWSPWYTRTRISPEKGERWFCAEGEAIAAGWRPPEWGTIGAGSQ
jgi:endonuclease YncB( thermonuclease family)